MILFKILEDGCGAVAFKLHAGRVAHRCVCFASQVYVVLVLLLLRIVCADSFRCEQTLKEVAIIITFSTVFLMRGANRG